MIEPNSIISTIVGLSPSWIIIFVLPVMKLMLQKFTKKTTSYYIHFNDLANLYAQKGQIRPLGWTYNLTNSSNALQELPQH